MGVFARPDSKWWWLYLETTKEKERTAIRVGETTTQRRDSRALADALYHQRMNAAAARLYKLPGAKPAIRFADYAESYKSIIAHHRGHERETELLRYLTRGFGDTLLSLLDVDRVHSYITERRKTNAASTVNREIDFLKSMLRDAVPKYLDSSPLVGFKSLPVVKPKRRLMTAAEERKLLAALREPQDRAMVIVALDSLVRMGDLLELRKADRRGRWIYLRDPKTGEPTEVALSLRGAQALDKIKTDSPYYFPKFRTSVSEQGRRYSVRCMLRTACERAGLPYGRKHDGITFHWATRRTGATRMLLKKGISVPAVQRQGTWKNPDVLLQIYAEAGKADLLKAVAPFTAHSRDRRKRA